MLAHRLRRWANIALTLGQRLVFAGYVFLDTSSSQLWLVDILKHQDKHVFSVHGRRN